MNLEEYRLGRLVRTNALAHQRGIREVEGTIVGISRDKLSFIICPLGRSLNTKYSFSRHYLEVVISDEPPK